MNVGVSSTMLFLFETCAAVTHFTELLLTVALEACLDLTGLLNMSFLGRQSKVTCACVLSCVKHFIVAWIAWALTQGGNHTALQWCLNFHYKSPVITVSQSTGVWVA